MILPIHVYGARILRVPATPVEENDADLQRLIDDMIETMHAADGIGLAAPQVGRTERVFVIDLGGLRSELIEQGEIIPEQPMVFVNPQIVSESDEETSENLSRARGASLFDFAIERGSRMN